MASVIPTVSSAPLHQRPQLNWRAPLRVYCLILVLSLTQLTCSEFVPLDKKLDNGTQQPGIADMSEFSSPSPDTPDTWHQLMGTWSCDSQDPDSQCTHPGTLTVTNDGSYEIKRVSSNRVVRGIINSNDFLRLEELSKRALAIANATDILSCEEFTPSQVESVSQISLTSAAQISFLSYTQNSEKGSLCYRGDRATFLALFELLEEFNQKYDPES